MNYINVRASTGATEEQMKNLHKETSALLAKQLKSYTLDGAEAGDLTDIIATAESMPGDIKDECMRIISENATLCEATTHNGSKGQKLFHQEAYFTQTEWECFLDVCNSPGHKA